MAGNTGKMTREALAARGPRMRLMNFYSRDQKLLGSWIERECASALPYGCAYLLQIGIASKSYSLSYLLGIVRAWRIQS